MPSPWVASRLARISVDTLCIVPRPLKQSFRCRPIESLTAQLLFSPPEVRQEQVRRAERLHDEIDGHANYSLEFIKYRITGFRDADSGDIIMTGQAILPDLRLMIDRVSASAPFPAAGEEAIETPEEAAARLGVSTKTLSRWRQLGLRWRWVRRDANRKPGVMFTREALDVFARSQGGRVTHAAAFTQMTPAMRKRIIARARRLVQARDLSPHRVAMHLSRRMGRAVETIRLLLEKHDRDHPQSPVFLQRHEPLTVEQKREIVHARSLGTPVSVLARRFRKTHTTIRRAVVEHRAAGIRRLVIRHIKLPIFEREDADVVILRPEPMQALSERTVSAMPVDDLPLAVRPWFAMTPLRSDDAKSLLIRMNYLRWRAAKVRGALDKYEPRIAELDRIEADLKQATAIRDGVVMRTLPLILSIARRQLIALTDRTQSPAVLMRLLEMGLPLGIDAIDEFDIRRNQAFEDYLRGLLMRVYATRTAMAEIHAVMGGDGGEGRPKARAKFIHQTGEEFLARLKELGLQQGVVMER